MVAVRYYFRRTVEKDSELSNGLLFARLEAVCTAQEEQFANLAGKLDRHAARLEKLLADVLSVAVDTQAGVNRIEAVMVTKADLDRLQTNIFQELARREMGNNREVRPRDGMSIRTEDERQKVRDFLRQYRSMSEADRQQRPALLDAVAKLSFAAGDYEQAQVDFSLLPNLLSDNQQKAQAHFNAYRASLEKASVTGNKNDYASALNELIRALNLDRRYLPFDTRKYTPLQILGAGGFGVTFLCKHKELDDFVAIKALLQEELELDADMVFSEGRLLRKIDHPAIIRMQDCGFASPETKSQPYLVMDYFDGQTLDGFVASNGTLSLKDAVALAKVLASGMKAAHGQGVLHRDIKPANVMVRKVGEDWQAKIIDFGLALKREMVELMAGTNSSQRQKSVVGSSVAGTVDYAAPEQMGKLPGVAVGPYSDVYGWGKTVCFALFKTPSPITRHFKSKEVPDSLKELLEACLDEEPPIRPQSFNDVLDRLDRIEEAFNPIPAIPQAAPVALPVTVQWFYAKAGQQHGPVAEVELKSFLASGKVGPDDAVWRDGLPNWVPAKSVEGLVPKAVTTGVKVRLFCVAEKPPKLFEHIAKYNVLKVYINGKLKAEGNRLEGLDFGFEVGTGQTRIEIAWIQQGREQDRKLFEQTFPVPGQYELRFNFLVTQRFFSKHMQESTIEVLKEPG